MAYPRDLISFVVLASRSVIDLVRRPQAESWQDLVPLLHSFHQKDRHYRNVSETLESWDMDVPTSWKESRVPIDEESTALEPSIQMRHSLHIVITHRRNKLSFHIINVFSCLWRWRKRPL